MTEEKYAVAEGVGRVGDSLSLDDRHRDSSCEPTTRRGERQIALGNVGVTRNRREAGLFYAWVLDWVALVTRASE